MFDRAQTVALCTVMAFAWGFTVGGCGGDASVVEGDEGAGEGAPAAQQPSAPNPEEEPEPDPNSPELDPDPPPAIARLMRPASRCSEAARCNQVGMANYRREAYDVALTFFAKALELSPAHENAAYNAACMLAKLGEVEASVYMMTRLVRMNTDGARAKVARIATDGDFDGIRSDARFVEGVARVRAIAAEQAASVAALGPAVATNDLMVAVRRELKAGRIDALAPRAPDGERIEIRYRIEDNCCDSELGRNTVVRGGEEFSRWLRTASRSWRRACATFDEMALAPSGCDWGGLVILMNARCADGCCSHSPNSRARETTVASMPPLFLEEICFAAHPSAPDNLRIRSIEFSGSPCGDQCR